ncbi:DUF4270 family protein [Hymenobacter gummosus]|uniref:DUF4270 family protein n=1 Tax=Hymenobacter gummosus TaxID=1776032 RepID=UPI00140485BD|nr:DUF4270 family protein [Hymenobacter gummosus]
MTSALFSLGSCEDTNELGIGLPGTAPISTAYEDFPATVSAIQGSTILQDSLFTTQKSHFIVGKLRDGNTGGQLEARAFLEIAATGSGSTADTLPSQFAAQTPVLDSITMFAAFDRVYGSATTPVQLSVYDLQQPLDDFTTYSSSSSIPFGQPIVLNVPVSLNRTIRNKRNTLDSIQGLPIRIPISKAGAHTPFAVRLFDKLKTTPGVFLTDRDLQTVWKGIGLVSNTTGTAIAFNRSAVSGVNVFYHINVTPTVTKKKIYRLLFGDPFQQATAPRYFTNINYDLSAAPLPFNVLQGSGAAQVPASSSGGTVYTQDGVGLVAKIIIPGLDTLRNRQAKRNLIINRAELIIPLRPYSTAQFAAPSQLYLYEANNANNRVLKYTSGVNTVDRLVQNEGYLVPTTGQEAAFRLTEVSATNKYYSGLMTGYVQAYAKNQLSGPAPSAFLVSPTLRRPSSPLTLDRAAIDAQNIKLRVYYSNATAR